MNDAAPQALTSSTSAAAACPVASCAHCGGALPRASRDAYCCNGCRAVHGLLAQAHLLRYYELRDTRIEPAREPGSERSDHAWLEPIAARVAEGRGVQASTFKLQGLHCAACVWLIEQLFARHPGAARILINPGRGSVELCIGPEFPLLELARELEAFGYRLGELDSRTDDGSEHENELLLRTAVCMALGGNAMMFAAAIYLGLHDGPLYRLLHALNFACASLAVLIGGPVFVRSSWQALRRGILHLDLPISAGIALTYGAAVWSFVSGDVRAAYYDSLATFIGLMLLGRWLKERIVVRNRRQLLAESGADNLRARRVRGDAVEIVRATELQAGDVLLVPSGDLVPVSAELLDASATCSLDWIDGESEPRRFEQAQLIPAGAFNAGPAPLQLRAHTDFARSSLADLLARRRGELVAGQPRGKWFSGAYVISVLLAAGGGFVYWWLRTGDAVQGLEVATAVCVVTCPCAIGIATPLAYDLVLAGLRRAGLFVRTSTFLDRALQVRRVVFDKTGTLTTGRLELVDDAPLRALSARDRDALYTLVSGSTHPKSLALQSALSGGDARLVRNAAVRETAGSGLEATIDAQLYRLGSQAWASAAPGTAGEAVPASDDGIDLVFSRAGSTLCVLRTRETLRSDAAHELTELARAGYDTWILSGDAPARVRSLARDLPVREGQALGGLDPAGKSSWIAAHDHADLLMIGDGINDSLAVQQAFVSGTPSIDRAFMPWRTDFYFVTPGLAPIGLALRAAKHLARVVQRNQLFAIAYNVATVGVALTGHMQPWMAAVLMPLSSIVVLATTSWSLASRSRLWTS